MIFPQQATQWMGFPWNECKIWLEEQSISYKVQVWPPDERSQFIVDLKQCYVLQVHEDIDTDSVIVEVAGKMLGRKE